MTERHGETIVRTHGHKHTHTHAHTHIHTQTHTHTHTHTNIHSHPQADTLTYPIPQTPTHMNWCWWGMIYSPKYILQFRSFKKHAESAESAVISLIHQKQARKQQDWNARLTDKNWLYDSSSTTVLDKVRIRHWHLGFENHLCPKGCPKVVLKPPTAAATLCISLILMSLLMIINDNW